MHLTRMLADSQKQRASTERLNGSALHKHTKCLVIAAGVEHLPGKSNTQGADVPATSGAIICTVDCPWLLGQHLKIS